MNKKQLNRLNELTRKIDSNLGCSEDRHELHELEFLRNKQNIILDCLRMKNITTLGSVIYLKKILKSLDMTIHQWMKLKLKAYHSTNIQLISADNMEETSKDLTIKKSC